MRHARSEGVPLRPPQKLVLVDESPARRTPVADALRGAGYEVTEVPTIAAVIARLLAEGGELELIALGDTISEEEACALRDQLLLVQRRGLA
jgi:hypothetical protein